MCAADISNRAKSKQVRPSAIVATILPGAGYPQVGHAVLYGEVDQPSGLTVRASSLAGCSRERVRGQASGWFSGPTKSTLRTPDARRHRLGPERGDPFVQTTNFSSSSAAAWSTSTISLRFAAVIR